MSYRHITPSQFKIKKKTQHKVDKITCIQQLITHLICSSRKKKKKSNKTIQNQTKKNQHRKNTMSQNEKKISKDEKKIPVRLNFETF